MSTTARDVSHHPSLSDFQRVWGEPRGLIGYLRTINNIPIARRYMITAFAFFLAGGVQALLMRIQLGTPENTFLDAETYNQLFTMHGTTMMFLFVIPFIEAIANYLLPLLLGTRDLPFPRLTALSYWTYLFGGLFLYASFVVDAAPDAGWFAYVPLSGKPYSPGLNMDFWDIGLSVAEVSAVGAAAELIVGILRMRAPGMTLGRMPLFAWAMLVAAFMMILAFTPLIVATAMLELDRKEITHFFTVGRGGDPLLWQHLFWTFGHPEVYIMLIPAAGIVSHVVQTFSRRPIVGYPAMVISIVAIGAISFALWAHHMFATGMSAAAINFFTIASMLIALPSGVQVFGWIATMWRGVEWKTPMLFVGGFVAIFVLGGITGVMVASGPFDAQAHDSYFVVAHFHYVLIGGVVFPLLAGMYYWIPKMTGRLMSERLGRWNFWLMFVFFNVAFFPMHISGLLGMPRRVYTYDEGLGWDTTNLVSTIGALGFAFGVLLFIVNVVRSRSNGSPAGNDPWRSDTLEWSEASPPADAQFPFIPVVQGRHPLWQQSTLHPTEPNVARTMQALEAAPTRWRGALCVSVRGATPIAVVHLPGPTIWPFVLSVSFVFLFAGALIDSGTLAAIGALIAAAGITGWFWPTATEGEAVREMTTAPQPGRLPLAVAGPLSNGWWGTAVLLLVLSVALITLLASYVYLARGWVRPEPLDGTEVLFALGAAAAAAGSGLALRAAVAARDVVLRARRRTALGLAALGAVTSLLLWWLLYGYHETRFTRTTDAEGAMFFAFMVFQLMVTLLVAIVAGVANAWAWRAPADPRGNAPASNGALIAFFLAASWIVLFATLTFVPRFMQM
jgi:cytochrome c oxidase subunit I+III